jgi:hypothetical protein
MVINPILAAHGVNAENPSMLTLATPAAAKALKDGEADVFVLIIELNAPVVQALLRDPTVRLMSVTQAEAISRVYPFLTRLVLPQGVIDFEKNILANDVSLIADTQAVLARKTLHPELIYLLAQAISEEHRGAGVFQKAGDFPTVTDPEFPVAQNALDFYKNGPSSRPVFAVLDHELCKKNHRVAGDSHRDRPAAGQLCAKTVPVARGISSELDIPASQGYRSEPARMYYSLGGVGARS